MFNNVGGHFGIILKNDWWQPFAFIKNYNLNLKTNQFNTFRILLIQNPERCENTVPH